MVGALRIPVPEATRAVADYTSDSSAYAWPYYDHLVTGTGSTEISDADLLAPALLNAAPRIAGFAGLQKKSTRSRLERGLVRLGDAPALTQATDEDIRAIGDLYSVLDDPGVPYIQGTTLSKVLHRKRPDLIPLYDREVRRAYRTDPTVLGKRPRGGWTWAEFMSLLASAMRRDLGREPETWVSLTALVPDGSLTPLRALDILAWTFARSGTGQGA